MSNILDAILELVNKNTGDFCCYEEDFNASDFSGGNFDDAWQGGFNDGVTAFANELSELIENFQKENNEI